MKTAVLFPTALLALAYTGQDLATHYEAERALRVTVETSLSMETTASEMLRDGEPVEGRGGFGGGGSTETRRTVHVDRYLECADGSPTRVRRTWESAEGDAEMNFGDQSRGTTLESPFDGLTVEITKDDDDLAYEVVEGSDPGQEALEKLRPSLPLDALLPSGAVEEGDSWDLEPEAIARALGLDLADVLFQRPAPEGGQGGGRGGGRGGRGGGRGGGGSTMTQMASAEWTGSATYKGQDERDGVACAVITLEFAAERDVEGEGMSGSFEFDLEGELWVDLEGRCPVALQIEGSLRSETDSERERQGTVFETHRESEGSFELSYVIEQTAFEEE